MKRKLRKILNTLLAVIISGCILLFGASGCFDGCGFAFGGETEYELSFKKLEINLVKGDEYTVTAEDFSFTPSQPKNFSFTLSSSDENVLSVNQHKIKAKNDGSATLSAVADGKTVSCTVNVTKEIESVRLASRNRSRLLSENREIDVYAIINENSTAKSDVVWEIDGVEKSYNGGVYTLAPPIRAKLVTVKATVTDSDGAEYSDELTVNWCDEFIREPILSLSEGKTMQTLSETSAVTFSLDYETTSDAIVEWFVNGKLQEDEDANEFTLDSRTVAGSYKVSATVNGAPASVPSGNNVVSVVGAKKPTGLEVDFDSLFPSLAITWDEAAENESFSISIVDELGNEKIFTATGNSYIIDEENIDLSSHSYTVKIKSEGDGAALIPSEYTDAVNVAKVDSLAKSYLAKSWFGGNYYVSSDSEFFTIYDYFMLYREQPTNGQTRAEYTIYMGYDSVYTLDRLTTIAFNRSGYTGEYEIDARQNGNVVTLTFVFKTVSVPSLRNVSVVSKPLNGIDPHISKTGREEGGELYIDGLKRTASVNTTDQLYRVAEMGFKPIIEGNVTLQKYYDYARSVLNSILDDGMTQVEKAHAIYDWIMWRVQYDDGVVGINDLSVAVKYAPFYMEGVLTDEYYYAVCDGMSKAYSLLCNMEGIPCLRITGYARTEKGNGGHAWNKIYVDGGWYIVDCTWGDTRISVSERVFGSISSVESYELASHYYFMKTDGEMMTHTEDEDTDYPRTSALPYNVYSQIDYSYSDGTLVPYVYSAEGLIAYATSVASVASESLSGGSRSYVVNGTTTTTQFFAIEIYIAASAYAEVQPIIGVTKDSGNPLKTALSARSLKYNLYLEGNRVIVVASKTRNLC